MVFSRAQGTLTEMGHIQDVTKVSNLKEFNPYKICSLTTMELHINKDNWKIIWKILTELEMKQHF